MPTRSVPTEPSVKRGEIGLGRLKARDDAGCVAKQELARLGERDAARSARPLDEPLADHPLERLDLLADRGLGVAEALRGPAERALLGDRLKRGEMPQFHPEPSIRPHNRNES